MLLENNDYHQYYDYLSDYSPYTVFEMVMSKKNLWKPLIKPSMYQQALSEFVKYGKLTRFPVKYIYQWMGIIMKNTAILHSTTEIAGHSEYLPFEDFYDYFFNDEDLDQNGVSWSDFLAEHNLNDSDKYEAMTEYLDEVGFYDNLVLPDGSDAWSDFGIEPIEKLIATYNDDLPPENVLVLINKILDITHHRGDLSSMFIDGGAKTLNNITYNESKQNKKIYLSENKLKTLLKLWSRY